MDCQIRFNNENIETCFLFPIYDSSLPYQLRFQMDQNNNYYHHQRHNQSSNQINNVNVDEEIVQLPEALPITDFDNGTMKKSTNKMTMSTKHWKKIFDKDDKILNQSIITTNNNVDNKVVRRNRNRAQNILITETLVDKLCLTFQPNPILRKKLVDELLADLKTFYGQRFKRKMQKKLFNELGERLSKMLLSNFPINLQSKTTLAITSSQQQTFHSNNFFDEDRYAKEFEEIEKIGDGGK